MFSIAVYETLHQAVKDQGFPGGTRDKELACLCRRRKRCRFDP